MKFTFILLLSCCCYVSGFDIHNNNRNDITNGNNKNLNNRINMNRRDAIISAVAGISSISNMLNGLSSDPAFASDSPGTLPVINTSEFKAYNVISDDSASLNPYTTPVNNEQLIQQLAISAKNNGENRFVGGALWLGEHHNSEKDHQLQVTLIESIYNIRKQQQLQGNSSNKNKNNNVANIGIGLEQIQIQFQSVLDDFIYNDKNKMTTKQLRKLVEWDKRWVWPFEQYEPIFAVAQKLKIPLIALNVNSEDMTLVEQYGLPGISRDALITNYITDPQGFADFAKSREFSTYVNYVIQPSYKLHQEMGLLRKTMSGAILNEPMPFNNFFSGRILWDETMASRAYSWVTKQGKSTDRSSSSSSSNDALIIGLVGADHVKFRNGIPGRFARMVSTSASSSASTPTSTTTTASSISPSSLSCTSIMLNPTSVDTQPSSTVADMYNNNNNNGDRSLTLQLRYLREGLNASDPSIGNLPENTGGVMPLADYIVLN